MNLIPVYIIITQTQCYYNAGYVTTHNRKYVILHLKYMQGSFCFINISPTFYNNMASYPNIITKQQHRWEVFLSEWLIFLIFGDTWTLFGHSQSYQITILGHNNHITILITLPYHFHVYTSCTVVSMGMQTSDLLENLSE